ncbi:MAG: RNA-binding S4 domain-containing protein [Crocinitomicaceae bacterium]|nr:RNA-binding S4 domain-containing protein [Crocinitomicaceae bacterium]
MQEEFKIEGDYIELMQFLKAIGLAQTGGHAKMIVDSEMVMRDGEVELRRRAKLRAGEMIQIRDQVYNLK